MRKWKSRLTNGAMKTQTYAQIRIGEVLEVTATIPMTPERAAARGLVIWAGTLGKSISTVAALGLTAMARAGTLGKRNWKGRDSLRVTAVFP